MIVNRPVPSTTLYQIRNVGDDALKIELDATIMGQRRLLIAPGAICGANR